MLFRSPDIGEFKNVEVIEILVKPGAAIKDVFEDTRSILEPAGALSIAGMKKDILISHHSNKKMVAIACGANMNFERLRFVAERAELGECKEVMMAIL